MKHRFYLDRKAFTYDGEIPCTHVVIGQRDQAAAEEKLRGELSAKDYAIAIASGKLTEEQRVARAAFVFDLNRGWYALKPLEWAVSEADAETIAEDFKADGWLNVAIREVSQVITHA